MALCALAFGLAGAGGAAAQGFTTWPAAIQPGATVTAGGLSQEITYTSGASGITAAAQPSAATDGALTETLDANSLPTSISLRSGARSVNIVKANGDTIVSAAGGRAWYGRASDWTRQTLTFDPTVMGWTYQTFGVWESGVGQAAGGIGGVSVGAATSGTATPQVGVADFAGAVGGVYIDTVGQTRLVTGDMGMKVNFAAHTADFWTSGMQDSAGKVYNDLALSGSFVGLANHSKLYGTLTTTRLTGSATAQFYGPAGEEIGGVFGLAPKSGASLERFSGAFGGKRASTANPLPARVGAAAPVTGAAFTTWINVASGSTMMTGTSQEQVIRQGAGGDLQFDPPSEVGGATFTVTMAPQGYATGFNLDTPTRSLAFSAAKGDIIGFVRADPRILVGINATTPQIAMTVDPDETGWNYQTFGAWQAAPDAKTVSFGAASVGVATPGASIPTTGTGAFSGMLLAGYVDPDGYGNMLTADMTLSVDFAARQATFSSGNMIEVLDRNVVSGTGLTGTLTYAAKTNGLTGSLTTANGRLSGTANARFYGPAAQEVGGTFILSTTGGAGSERMSGAFGAKR